MKYVLERIDKLLLFFIIYTIVFILFFNTLSYTLPFVLAFICALLLQKPTKYLIDKFKLSNSIASLITTIIFFTIIIILLSWGTVSLTSETISLGKNLQNYISKKNFNFEYFEDKIQIILNNFDPSFTSTLKNNFSKSLTTLATLSLDFSKNVISSLVNFLTSIPYILMVIIFTLLCTYFFTKDFTSLKNRCINVLPFNNTNKLSFITSEIKTMLTKYLMSYLLLIFITFIETLIVFLIFKVNYAVTLSIICGIVDIIPILGIGFIYIPLSLFYIFSKNYFVGFGILISYSIVVVIRNILEPRIVSSSLGLHPVAVLAAIFIGLKANGISGMFFCIFFVVLYKIFSKLNVL